MTIENGFYKRNNGSNALIQVVGEHESGDALCLWAFGTGKPFRYHSYEFNKEFESVSEEFVNSIERHCCPDHAVVASVFTNSVNENNPNPDRWDVRDGFRSCSYCGSIHPDDLLELIKKHGISIIEPTDKSYKCYINAPNFNFCKYYFWHNTTELIDEYNKQLIIK